MKAKHVIAETVERKLKKLDGGNTDDLIGQKGVMQTNLLREGEHYKILGINPNKFQNTYFDDIARSVIAEASIRAENRMQAGQFSVAVLKKNSHLIQYAGTGAIMDIQEGLLEKIADEMDETKQKIQKLTNELTAMYDITIPKLTGMVKEIRTKRMTIVTELKQSLKSMQDVRKFFLESDYEKEVKRLTEFVELAERMKGLLDSGMMDAISDVMLKLAIGSGDSPNEGNQSDKTGIEN